MKKSLLFVLSVFAICSLTKAQEPLFDSTKIWSHLSITPSWGGPPPHAWATDFHKVSGTTIINSVTYMNLMTSTDQNQTNWNLQGYVREDGSGKVYFRGLQDSTDWIIYDFGLEMGDTIILSHLHSFPYIVTDIDSVFYQNTYRKRITFNVPETWVEGIGSMMGLMCSGYGELVGVNHYMLCYFENDTLMYSNPTYPLCYYNTVGIDEQKSLELEILLIPNPLISTSTFKISGEQDFSGAQLEIYNLTGSLVRTYSVKESEIRILASDYPGGMYFYRLVTQNGQSRTGKFVVK